MPQGLQIWDASNNLILDISSRVYKTLAVQTVNEGSTASISIPILDSSASIIAVDNTTDEDSGAPVITSIGSGSVNIGWVGGVGGTATREVSILSV